MAVTNNQKLFDKYIQKMESLNKDKNVGDIYDALLNGKNSYLRMSHVESSHFDPTWIKVIEDVLYDLGEIISNPRSVTKVESNVVPVELAKKVNGESVQHLASHTQYIKEIDENGDVVPSKILSHSNEDNIHTYENRFIATFIRRLVLFIEKRYQFVTENVSLFTDNVLLMKNETIVNGQLVEIETKVRVRKENEDEIAVQAREYIERIKSMREYVTYYYSSPFMKQMKTEKDVRKPIIQTNIIRKNPKYRHCFETFMFIEKFDNLGVTYKVDENYSLFSPDELREYNYLLLSQYLSLQDKRPFKEVKKNEKVYKPKIKTSIDDEKFIYGPLYKGPIEFVRIDEEYHKYRESLVRKDLPEHPTKREKEYYEDEYNFRKLVKEEQKQIDRLLSRTYKDIKEFEKAVEKILALRQKEEFKAEQERLRMVLEEEDRRIEAKRQEIIAAAKAKAHEEKLRLQEEEERYLAGLVKEQNKKEEPQEEIVEKSVEEEPVIVSAPVIKEALKEKKKPSKAKNNAPKKEKKAESIPEIEKKERKPREKKEDILEKIPGKFIVKAREGYYINDKKFSVYKKGAKIFDDFNVAKQIKARFGGKVIKL